MKTFRNLLIGALLVLAGYTPSYAQATLNQTSLAANVNGGLGVSAQQVVVVASASSISLGDILYVPSSHEEMLVNAITGTSLTVRRGYNGTTAWPAASGAVVFTGTAGRFIAYDPSGTCVPTSVSGLALPAINTRNGNVWNCAASTSGYVWSSWNGVPNYTSVPRTVVAGNVSATTGGYTVVMSDYIVALSTTGTGSGGLAAPVTTFRLPTQTLVPGKVLVVKDESGGIGATTFINIVGTIDGVATGFALKTAYGGVTLYAGSGGWFTFGCWAAGCR